MTTNNDIRKFLGLPAIDREYQIVGVDALGAHDNTLMFINKNITWELLSNNKECTYLVDPSCLVRNSENNDFIVVENPKYKFCQIVDKFYLKSNLQLEYDNRAPFLTYECKEISLGERIRIDRTAIVGGTDFSPVLADDGTLVQFPQLGGVKIGNDVVIKYNSMIGKGTFGYTQIGDNTMIDYNCQIGHNCIIGKSCIIAAGTIIGGSTTVGDHTTIGMGCMIRNGIKIGKGVSIGMGSVVIKDIPDNCVVVGNPAHIIEHEPIFSQKGLV